ncbi:MAG: PEGA domain-containing protein [Candidatus Xenobia bacterium]
MNTNTIRLIVMVLFTYIVGLGTGVVAGVAISFREFGKPMVVAAGAPAVAAVTPAEVTPLASTSPLAVSTPSPTRASASRLFSPTMVTPTPAPPPPPVAVHQTAAPSPTEEPPSPPPATSVDDESPTPDETPTPEATPTHRAAPEPATLVVGTNKGNGFRTYIDGRDAGETPVEWRVQPGKRHTVKVVGGDKFTTWEGIVQLTPGQRQRVIAELHTRAAPPPPPPAYNPPPVYNPPPSYGPPPVSGTRRF